MVLVESPGTVSKAGGVRILPRDLARSRVAQLHRAKGAPATGSRPRTTPSTGKWQEGGGWGSRPWVRWPKEAGPSFCGSDAVGTGVRETGRPPGSDRWVQVRGRGTPTVELSAATSLRCPSSLHLTPTLLFSVPLLISSLLSACLVSWCLQHRCTPMLYLYCKGCQLLTCPPTHTVCLLCSCQRLGMGQRWGAAG